MIATGSVVSTVVEKPVAGGAMIGRVDGRIVLVSGAIPGERVRIHVDRVSKGVAHAHVVDVEEPSPDRRPGAGDPLCGGSLYAHIAYPRQLGIKGQVIADAFGRIAKMPLADAVAVAPSPEEGYRMRARLHVRGDRIGFFREGTHDICDARPTRQLLPATCDAIDRLSAALRSIGNDNIREIEISENVTATERAVHFVGDGVEARTVTALSRTEGFTPGPYVTDVLSVGDGDVRVRRHVRAFFQGNRFLLDALVAHVVERVPVGASVADLYAGAGVFGISAAITRGAAVYAVEDDRFAADDLHANAEPMVKGGRVTTVKSRVEDLASTLRVLRRKTTAGPLAEVVIVDPPRIGMSNDALDVVLSLKSRRLIYVSCDVATLARDARKIVDAGYRVDRMDAFDLFPNTPHVETVVVFDAL